MHYRDGRPGASAEELGVGGRLEAISADRMTLTLSRTPATDGTVWIWTLDDRVVSRGYTVGDNRQITLNQSLGRPPDGVTDDPAAYRLTCFDTVPDLVRLRITGKEPAGRRVRFVARDEDARYYSHRTSDLTWNPLEVQGRKDLAAIGGLHVTETELGVRVFNWAASVAETIVGYRIRHGAPGADWMAMDDLHEGNLDASPWESMDRPEAGTWRFGLCGLTRDGRRTEPTYVDATLGAVTRGLDGTDGQPGADGDDGEDGAGVEYIFARTAKSVTRIQTNQRPLNTWNYDRPQTRNGLQWRDGAPALTDALPKLWRSERAVPGAPSAGDSPGTRWGNWSPPTVVGAFGRGVEYIFARMASATIPTHQRPAIAGVSIPAARQALWYGPTPRPPSPRHCHICGAPSGRLSASPRRAPP